MVEFGLKCCLHITHKPVEIINLLNFSKDSVLVMPAIHLRCQKKISWGEPGNLADPFKNSLLKEEYRYVFDISRQELALQKMVT